MFYKSIAVLFFFGLMMTYFLPHPELLKSEKYVEKETYLNTTWTNVLNTYRRQDDMILSLITDIKGVPTTNPEIAKLISSFEQSTRERMIALRSFDFKTHDMMTLTKHHTRSTAILNTLLHAIWNDPQFAHIVESYTAKRRSLAEMMFLAELHYTDAVREFNDLINTLPHNIIAFINKTSPAQKPPHHESMSSTSQQI